MLKSLIVKINQDKHLQAIKLMLKYTRRLLYVDTRMFDLNLIIKITKSQLLDKTIRFNNEIKR